VPHQNDVGTPDGYLAVRACSASAKSLPSRAEPLLETAIGAPAAGLAEGAGDGADEGAAAGAAGAGAAAAAAGASAT
jgi:hypothetical protein